MHYTYIVQSARDNKFYIGQTNNLKQRLKEHNSGLVRTTKNRKPLKLVYYETYNTRKEAVDREKYFKTHKGWNERKKLLKL